ncbi:MAG: hypothetical protein J7L45_00135 [Candidatus Aenigmarchaeota archaeon]|nr:hypothetical protein [Candidatus Aenigmarchaeota archaeon]
MKLYKKRRQRRMSGIGGFATGFATRAYVHEPGHWIPSKITGLNPEMELESYGISGGCVKMKQVNSNFLDSIISAGGCAFNYLAGLGFGYAASKLDKKTHPNEKAFLTGLSIFNSVYPAYYAIIDKMNIAGNDFWNLNRDGLPYEVTIPLTMVISSAMVYYNWKGWKDDVGKMKKRINYYGLPLREKMGKWKTDKEKTIEELEKFFESERNPRRKAKKAFKKLNKIEVIGNEYKEKDLEKFGKYLGLDLDETKDFVEKYVWGEF